MLRMKTKAMMMAAGVGIGMLSISVPADAGQKSQDTMADAAVTACELMGGDAELRLWDDGSWLVWCTFSGDSRHCLIIDTIFDCPFLNEDMTGPGTPAPRNPHQLPVASSSAADAANSLS